MKGIVKSVSNFLKDQDWLFIIEDSSKSEYYIMAEPFYKKNGLKSPVTKRELDNLKENMQIDFDYIHSTGENIITRMKW
jgi:hypothetical protein